MAYDIDLDYPFDVDEQGVPYLPEGVVEDGNLYLLPNGKYLPQGLYRTQDGGHLIYEPSKLSPFADMLESVDRQTTTISVEKALEIARERLGTDKIILSETNDLYIAGQAYRPDEVRPGDMPISINKTNGEVKTILLPSEEGFAIIEHAKRVRIKGKKQANKE